jgi:glycolate oxidase
MYEYDGSVDRARPEIVVFPSSSSEVSQIVKLAVKHDVPIVGRGAGTGLSGGALARGGGIMIAFGRMNRILEIDLENRRAVVQPGVPHTLAYGVTTNHVTGLELVLPDGEIKRIGGKLGEAAGYDLCGLLVGSEGTLALVTEITARLSRKPEAVKTLLAIFETVDDATETVTEMTARAITPAACEMMDGWTLCAVEDYVHAGFPRDCGAILLIEVEGLVEAVASQSAGVVEVCKAHGAREVRTAKDDKERELLWKGRKTAFGALGRLAPSNYVLDAVIPRSKLPQALRQVLKIGQECGLKIGNIFHAGDGNLHPLVLFDPRDRSQFEKAVRASEEIVRYCVEIGGALTGEHGVGMEKSELMTLMFSDADFALMRRVHQQFNPTGLLNPGKVFPIGKGCGETRIRTSPMHSPVSA